MLNQVSILLAADLSTICQRGAISMIISGSEQANGVFVDKEQETQMGTRSYLILLTS